MVQSVVCRGAVMLGRVIRRISDAVAAHAVCAVQNGARRRLARAAVRGQYGLRAGVADERRQAPTKRRPY